ncbi:glyoxylate reductase/hydroxypyruvate reductase-like [Sitophilus oryzae]|uniref:Glyoxylate reductase/hydroxypyruvate reductase n=1 Tax=Sitophilus oryzae TaxID=7048 RepID=A0A6J2Y9H9_SITOR|nr:glyoxylate reductase/hydroxypyruvate reductase-like [Sitophilus oryzae]
MSLPRVFVSNHTVPETMYDAFGTSVEVIRNTEYDRASILKLLPRVKPHGLFWCAGVTLDKEILDAAGPQLKVVGCMSSGYNHVDVAELKSRGIPVAYVPSTAKDSVSNVAILLALAASRRFTEGRWNIEQGRWKNHFDAQWLLGQEISDSTVGIVGFGGIGHAIAKKLKAFGIAKLLYTGHKEKPEAKELGAQFVDQETLTKESDFIFISAPLNEKTRKMCNADFFSKMKNTGILVNVSRGGLVDHDALLKALKDGEIYSAGLDVTDPEPLNVDSELLKLPNIVITPHIGASTFRARNAMGNLVAKNILLGLKGEKLLTPLDI